MNPNMESKMVPADVASEKYDDSNVTVNAGAASMYIDPVKERKMMLKFDIFAIGAMGLFYMMANLDRGNLGNAQIAGMNTDIGLVGNQFGTATSLLFATYVTLETPTAILLKIVGPKYLLTFCAFAWGCCTLAMGFIQNWQGLYVCRLLIGFFEAGLIPCINVYISLVYKKSERGKRASIIFAFSAIASAFGGLLAYGLTQINGPNGFEGWRWLFVVEGMMTILIVPVYYFTFPKTPRNAWFLTTEEKQMMVARYASDPSWGIDEDFSWAAVFSVLLDWKWYAFFIYQFSMDVTLYGFTTFLPQIIKGMGYTSVNANLLTVPVYVSGLLWFLFVAYMSDRTMHRGGWLASAVIFVLIGNAIQIGTNSVGARYFGCFLIAMGIYPAVGLSIMWLSDNVAQHFRRATMIGATYTIANTSGVAVGQMFTSDTAPRYIKGLSIAVGFNGVALVCIGVLMGGMWTINKRRERLCQEAQARGEPLADDTSKGDLNVHYRYTL